MKFKSDYAEVEYIESDNVVLLVWKKEAHLNDYREPTEFALQLLKEKNCNFIIDARNGFEDDKADVEWGFSYLLPEMSKTECKKICFIMTEVNEEEIGEEMDMWTAEFSKYFKVYKAETLDKAVSLLSE